MPEEPSGSKTLRMLLWKLMEMWKDDWANADYLA